MTIIVFLIDTSASMYQRTYLGGCPTLLDVAKGAVETFVKVRQRSPESRGDRYMLLSFEEPPMNIKAGWKENLATFMNELKNLRCDGLTTMGPALKHTFDVLNINRMQTGIDTYGQGRCPFFLEPSVIIVITDGGKLTSVTGVQEDLTLPMYSPIPGSELTREPFRWDQRLFSLVLRLPGTPALDRDVGLVPSDSSPIDVMCEVTGGRSYCITSHRMLMQCIDSLVQKVQSGVVINFEKIGPDPPIIEGRAEGDGEGEMETTNSIAVTNPKSGSANLDNQNGLISSQKDSQLLSNNSNNPWHTCRRLIYVPRSAQKGFAVGFWPIPENFWPDQNSPQLPARTAHPNVKFSCISQEPMVIENLPFDKYELEPSPLTQYILARKQPTVCWQVFVSNSYKNSDVGHPFGYLKASTNLSCVNLFVMPYNYPVLLPLLEELFKVHRQKPTNDWRILFQNYLRTMPPYYASPLRRALTRMGAQGNLSQTLVPDTLDNSLSYSVSNYLKRLKNQAKVEFDRMCNEVGNKHALAKIIVEGVRVIPRSPLKKELISHPCLQDKFMSTREQLNEYGGFTVGIPSVQPKKGKQSYQNVQDIPRISLIDQLVRMRAAFVLGSTKMLDEDGRHSLPVSQMGNYQEHLKRQPAPLREIESAPLRQHMFGNPFKIDKRMMVDEADIDVSGGSSNTSHRSGSKRNASQMSADPSSPRLLNKRKPGPIPKDTVIRRPLSRSGSISPTSSPPQSPPTSPLPWANADGNVIVPVENRNGEVMEISLPLVMNAEVDQEPEANHVQDDDRILTEINGNYEHVSVTPAVPLANLKVEIELRDSPQIPQDSTEIVTHNLSLRKQLFREVRRPGKNHTNLFKLLKATRGDGNIRSELLKDIVREALRFKRRQLANLLEEFVFEEHA